MLAKELREQACEANLALPRRGLALFTWGNASAIDHREGLLAIKPSGVDYDELRPEHMVVLDFSGRIVEGQLRPSSDTPTHLELARAFKVGGVVHTHSRYATMWAQAGLDLPCYGTTQADYFLGAVPFTRHLRDDEVAEHYEHHTGAVIVETLRSRGLDPGDVPGALVRNHAPFTWGTDADAAVYHARVLEEVAQLALGTRLLNAQSGPLPEVVLNKHHRRKHGPDAYYGRRSPYKAVSERCAHNVRGVSFCVANMRLTDVVDQRREQDVHYGTKSNRHGEKRREP